MANSRRDLYRSVGVHRLRNLGGIPKRPLHGWELPLSVLLARDFRELTPCHVWAKTRLVSILASFLTRTANPPVPGAL